MRGRPPEAIDFEAATDVFISAFPGATLAEVYERALGAATNIPMTGSHDSGWFPRNQRCSRKSSAASKRRARPPAVDNPVTRRRDAFGNRLAAPAHEQSVPASYIRTVWVYVPAQYVPGTPAPFIVVQDGHGFLNHLPRVLDNLIAAGRTPTLIAILVDSGGGDAQGSQRGLEYDTVSGGYAEFIETEVLPRVMRETGVTLTRDPDGRAAMGVSSGAACAFTMAWFRPDLYRRVLSYSGT